MQSNWICPLLAALAFLVCYLRSFLLPHTPLALWGDQLGFATKGVRILQGELPYRDFFEFLTPGTDLVYALLFRCAGISLAIPNLTMAALAAATVWMLTWIARRLQQPSMFTILPATLMIGLVLYGSLDATHHWFSTVLIMAAACVMLGRTSSFRIATSGALIGLATSSTQTKGVAVAVGIVVFLFCQAKLKKPNATLGNQSSVKASRQCLIFFASALVIFALINGPFILAAGPNRWIDQVLIFPVRYFGSVSANNWQGVLPEFQGRSSVLRWLCFPFMYVVPPLIYIRFFVEMRRRAKTEPNEPWDKLLLIAIIGIAMLVVMTPAPSIRRLSCVSPPAMILLAWQLSRAGKLGKRVAAGLGAVSISIALAQIGSIQHHPGNIVDLPTGTADIPPTGNYELYQWMVGHTKPGQWYFGLSPLMLPLDLRNPTPVEGTSSGEYSRPEQIAAVIAGLERTHTPLLVLHPAMYTPHSLGYRADHLKPFQDYLYQHYHRTKVFAHQYEAWERID
jgi:hypothetical protein